MKIPVIHATTFTKDGKGGIKTAVVIYHEKLTNMQMQQIATKVGYSKTVFISASNHANYHVQFFTPNGEVNFSGHATIAAWACLFEKNAITAGTYFQDTKAGILAVHVREDGNISVQQAKPVFGEEITKKAVSAALNFSIHSLSEDLPIQIVSTGLRHIIVPVQSLRELLEMTPDFEKMASICRKYHAVDIHAFTFETENCYSTANCRNFAPLHGKHGESVSGTANSALACYLFHQKLVDGEFSLIFEQSSSLGMQSEINVKLYAKEDKIDQVFVDGMASILTESVVELF